MAAKAAIGLKGLNYCRCSMDPIFTRISVGSHSKHESKLH